MTPYSMKPLCPQTQRDRTTSVATRLSAAPLDAALIFGHSTFQRLLWLCTTLSIFVTLSHSLAIAVFGQDVEHWCKPPAQFAGTPTDVWKNQSIPVEADGTFSKCTRYEPPLETGNMTNNRTVVLCDAWDYNRTIKGQSIVSEWDLVCDRHWLVVIQPIIYFGGAAVTASVTGYIGDRVGRKPVFLVALLLHTASGTATMVSNTVVTFTILRFLTSASTLTVLSTASVLLFEMTETTNRVVYCSFACSSSTLMLQVFQLLLVTVSRHWVVTQAMVMVPSYFLLLAAYFIEESPSWLLALGDLEGTQRVVLRAASINGLLLDDVKARMSKIKYEQLRRGCMKMEAENSSALDLLFNASLRTRTVAIFACWFLILIHYYDTYLGETITESTTVRVTYILVRVPVTIALMFVLHHLSRRKVLCLAMVLMSVVVGFQASLVQQKDDSFLLAVTVILKALIIDAMVATAFVYTLEVFPTVLRVTGLAVGVAFARLGALITPFIKGPEPRIDRGFALAVSSGAFFLFGLAVLRLPETTEVAATNTIREAELEARCQPHAPDNVTRPRSRLLHLDASKRS